MTHHETDDGRYAAEFHANLARNGLQTYRLVSTWNV